MIYKPISHVNAKTGTGVVGCCAVTNDKISIFPYVEKIQPLVDNKEVDVILTKSISYLYNNSFP